MAPRSSSSGKATPRKNKGTDDSSEPLDSNGQLVLGDSKNLLIDDYVAYEFLGGDGDGKVMLGRIVSFPSSLTVKILQYDPCEINTVAQDPRSEALLKKVAKEKNMVQVYDAREALKNNLQKAVKEESDATQMLFKDRENAIKKVEEAQQLCRQFYSRLDQVRIDMSHHMHLWCCLRAMKEPPTDMLPIVQGVMLVLQEDRALHSWEEAQAVMFRNDFFQRVMDTDCAVQPMSESRCNRITALTNIKPERIDRERAKRLAEEKRQFDLLPAALKQAKMEEEKRYARFNRYCEEKYKSSREKEDVGIFHHLDVVIREWLDIQIELSQAGEARQALMNECFAEQEKQRVSLRAINAMRVNISRIEEEMLLKKKTILAPKKSGPECEYLKLDSSDYEAHKTFHRRTYGENDGRYVHEVILRQAILVNFGSLRKYEDSDGYVTLGKKQLDVFRHCIFDAAIERDANTMEELLHTEEVNEKELAELQARIDALRSKNSLSPEEAEELTQLMEAYDERNRRLTATLARIGHMYACCRGARDVTIAEPKTDTKYLRLPLKFSGDWTSTLKDPKETELLREAFMKDLEQVVAADAIQDITFRSEVTDMSGGQWRVLLLKQAAAGRLLGKPQDSIPQVQKKHLVAHFSVTYTGPLSEKELTYLYQHGVYPSVQQFYASRHDGMPTYPLNTYAQEQQCADKLGDWYLGDLPPDFNIAGAGQPTDHNWYLGPDGTDCMHFDAETERDPDWRRSHVVVPITRIDFDSSVVLRNEENLSAGDL